MAKGTSSISKTAVWILLGLLILGLAGFGATSFSGTTRAIGSVGTAEIRTDDYFRALQNEIRAIQAQTGAPLSVAEAEARGVTQQVLSRLVVSAAFEHEANAIGLSVGDAQVAAELREIPAFQGADGTFNREAYAFALRNAGLTEAQFEADLRAENAATLLQAGLFAGVRLPDTFADTLIEHAFEARDVTWARVETAGVDLGVAVPSDADLRAYYDDNIDRYTSPRTRQITYAWLTPQMILDTVEVPQDALRDAYEAQIDQFVLPERRLVERLPMGDSAAADAALARLADGAAFQDLVEERGLALEDIDLGDVTREDLGDAADAVFAASVGDVVQAPSAFGPALFRVNAVLSAQETSFEEAIPSLREVLVLDRAQRVIAGLAQGFDDELAAGATLEELARTTDMQLGQIAWTGGEFEGIAGFEAFREAAETVTLEDFPAIQDLDGDGIFALRLDAIEDPAPIPFETVADQVTADWQADARADALAQAGEALADRLRTGEDFTALDLTPRDETGLIRSARPTGLPSAVVQAAFDLDSPSDVRVVRDRDGAILVRLDAITPADSTSEDAQRIAAQLQAEAASGLANDLFRALSTDIQTRAGVEIDQAAINAVHTTMQ